MKNYRFKVEFTNTGTPLGVKALFKKCNKCKQVKKVTVFYKQKNGKYGYKTICEDCVKNRYTCICEICGKEFKNKNKNTRFCSQKCIGKWKSENMRGENSPFYGKHHSLKTKKKISGKNSVHYNSVEVSCSYCGSKVVVNKYKYENKNNHFCNIECKAKWQSENVRGENHPRYNPNLTDEERIVNRDYKEYIEFVKEVLKRDNYTCLLTGQVGKRDLAVHHLNGYNWCKEGRTDINNGVTLKKMGSRFIS